MGEHIQQYGVLLIDLKFGYLVPTPLNYPKFKGVATDRRVRT